MTRVAWLWAQRFRRSKHKNRFVNFISASSTAGIALGCAALIILLSVMNGFQKALEDQLLSLVPHVEFQAVHGGLQDWRAIVDTAERHSEVIAAAPVTIVNSMIQQGRSFKGVVARAIDPELEPRVSGLTDFAGTDDWQRFSAQPHSILLGYGLANELGLEIGDAVTLLVPRVESGRQGLQAPQRVQLQLAGTFRLGGELDYQHAYIHLSVGQQAMGLNSEANGVRLRVNDVYQAPRIAAEVVGQLNEYAYISDWTRTEGHLYRDIQLVRTVMYLVLVLVLAVASFNIVSTLVMVVQEKRPAIAILKTMGASDSTIMRTFVFQGCMNGIYGIVFGGLAGVILALQLPSIFAWLEHTFAFRLLPDDIYFVSSIPTQVQGLDVVLVLGVAFVTSLLATLYPAFKATQVNPARALVGE